MELWEQPLSRRRFLGATAIAAVGARPLAQAALRAPARLPMPGRSGIDHIVVVMMENRSFDHYLGWLPGADGKQEGFTFLDRDGGEHRTHRLTTFTGCGQADPDHSYEGGRVELDEGACDGWLWAGDNDEFCIGYYDAADLAFYSEAAPYWTTCDRYF